MYGKYLLRPKFFLIFYGIYKISHLVHQFIIMILGNVLVPILDMNRFHSCMSLCTCITHSITKIPRKSTMSVWLVGAGWGGDSQQHVILNELSLTSLQKLTCGD